MASSSLVVESPAYPYPSTLNPAGFISVKLSPNNYPIWETQILCLLESQELVGFIDGTFAKPPERIVRPLPETNGNGHEISIEEIVVNEDYRMWVRSDRLVKGWILGSLSDQVLHTITGQPTTACDVWTKLLDYQDLSIPKETEERYSKLKRRKDISSSLPLYKAALAGDWDAAKRFLDNTRGAKLNTIITAKQETALHIAVGTGKSIHFVQELVKLMSKNAITLKDDNGKTALAVAADIGNTEAAKILLGEYPELLSIGDEDGELPLHFATIGGHRDTIRYLMEHTKKEDFKGATGAKFLTYAVMGGFFDIVLDVLALEPYTEDTKSDLFVGPLYILAESVSFFRSGSNLNFPESLIYSCVPIKKNSHDLNRIDVEVPARNSRVRVVKILGCDYLLSACQRLNFRLWEVIGLMVPLVKKIQQKKLDHHQAVQLVKCLCEGIKSLEKDQAYFLSTYEAMTKAASLGIVEVVEGIVDELPCSVWSCTEKEHNIFQLAVMNRCEKVFNLLYQMSGFQQKLLRQTDKFDNSILHMAGQLAPSHKLNLVSGAALQMQRELQWFKEVEKFLGPFYRQTKNSSRETPAMVFTREHAKLVIAGEKWIKETATSCTIAAALIVTVVFAAAITVPGGSSGDGHPVFSNGRTFLLFGFSNAISLFASTTSLLMFLSILTARYAEQDFLDALPKRLIYGLFTLFLSISTMIIAFSSAAYLVFGHKRGWLIFPLAAASCLPIISFIKLQFPLLVDVFRSTYGRGIFGKQSNRPFY